MSSFSLPGKLLTVYPIQIVSHRFQKRDFVVEISETNHGTTFFDYISFSLSQTRCQIIDICSIGTSYTFYFYIRGRKVEKDGNLLYFNTLNCWQITPFPPVSSVPHTPVSYPFNNTPSLSTSSPDNPPY
jgi:hypothetical protein